MGDEREVVEAIERRRLDALVRRDMAVADPLHGDDYELITPSGRSFSKAEYLGDLSSGAIRYVMFEPASEVRVRVTGDAAIVRYRARIDIRFPGDGRDVGTFWHTDYYERRGGQWQAVWSQATETDGD